MRPLCPTCNVRELPDPARSNKSKCHTCDKRRERANNPKRAAFNALRDHTRERGDTFTMTFEEYKTQP